MDFLDKMNTPQREAVLHTEGPLLILAGAGSGKTRVLTHRIAYLIEEKSVYPSNILAITFTNKAAREMKERVEQLIGSVPEMWVSTFHAACARILRRDVERLGQYKKSFVIFDTKDQESIIKECLKELNLNEKNFPFRTVSSMISGAKDMLLTPDKFHEKYMHDFKMKKYADIYSLYQKKLVKNNAMDFDDILFKTVELLSYHEDILRYYQNKFKYIMVDEYQDTNFCQYRLISLLAKQHKNLCVVGDDDQCVPEGTSVRTMKGEVPVEKITEGMEVAAAVGFGEVSTGIVDRVVKKEYSGKLVKVKTAGGKEFAATPYHITFCSLNSTTEVYYVYLMYKKGFGYRIGQTQGQRSRKRDNIESGLAVRLNGEKADKMWILKVCKDKGEASLYEELLSVKYGIPKTCFHNKGRGIALSMEQIKSIFDNINTIDNAEKLMEDFYLLSEYPHHIASAVIRGQTIRRNVYVSYFSGKKTTEGKARAHRISLITSGEAFRQRFDNAGFRTRYSKENGWRVEKERKKYDDADEYVGQLLKVDESLELYKKAKLTKDNNFMFMPVGSLREGMSIVVYKNNELVEDVVAEISEMDYNGHVYDLSVPEFRQFLTNDVLVHNCIYSWRGADIGNILNFEKDFPGAKVIKLEQNYRSTQTILDAANCIIKNNFSRKSKKLWTDNPQGRSIIFHNALDEWGEANFIMKEIERLSAEECRSLNSFAILYRTNAQSRVLEEACMAHGVPYRIVGGFKFYDRKEVKDVIAYLRLIQNPDEDLSLKRVINVPKRGIGNTTLEAIVEQARNTGDSLFGALLEVDGIDGIGPKAKKSIKEFVRIMMDLFAIAEKESVSKLLKEVLERTGYLAELEKEDSEDARSRAENIRELLSATLEFEEKNEDASLPSFLEQMALMSDIDSLEEDKDAMIMMTLHSAKGLEYPYVFISGMEEGVFPSQRAYFEEKQMEEERRLMYVGITRAKERLYLTAAFERTLFGSTSYNTVSQFVKEIPKDLMMKV